MHVPLRGQAKVRTIRGSHAGAMRDWNMPDEPSKPSALLLSFLAREYSDRDGAFEQLCRAHPDHAAELREQYAAWKAGGLALGDGVDGAVAAPWKQWIQALGRRGPSWRRFETVGRIGKGGMGAIERVRDPDLDRELAMKLILPDHSNRSSYLARFLNEARIHARLDHPGIVPLHEIGIDAQGRVFFTMKLVKGRTLHDVLAEARKQPRSRGLAHLITELQRVCEAMAYAHSLHVIHRDLKPANIMIGDFGETYVMDFGLAKVVGDAEADVPDDGGAGSGAERMTMPGDVVGTPNYMAPEQAAGRIHEVGPQADVYAMGAILYEILAGIAPYEDRHELTSAADVVGAIPRFAPTPLARLAPKAPAELVSICEKAMARSRARRYPDMRAMAADLRAHLEQRVVVAHATGPVVELWKWVQRNRWTAAALALTLVAVMAGAYFERKQRQVSDGLLRQVYQLQKPADLDRLEREAATLWPPRSDLLPRYREWLRQADALKSWPDEYRRRLESIERKAAISDEDRWWQAQLHATLASFDRFFADDPAEGPYASVKNRFERAETLRAKTIDGLQAEWNEAIAAVRADPRFAGLELEPQEGLIPLGGDPRSGLQEFGLALSGKPPKRAESNALALSAESAVVLVLLPGGTFTMGVSLTGTEPPDDPVRPDPDEQPAHRVTLAPFFLSKYELTAAQWLRLNAVGSTRQDVDPAIELSRDQCTDALPRWGLSIPTEAQWEFAARAGAAGPYWFGDDPLQVQHHGNVADQALFHWRIERNQRPESCENWDDGFYWRAPVDAFDANSFGLFGVVGNVWECVRDDYEPVYSGSERGPEGLRSATHPGSVIRGGSFYSVAASATSYNRYRYGPGKAEEDVGVRPSRSIDP